MLSDSGLTRGRDQTGALTEPREFVGTSDYVSPEQIENQEVSGQTDVYALACVAFECLAGQPPFQGGSAVGLLLAHLHDERPSATQANPRLPVGVDLALSQGMAIRPRDRHASAIEFVDDLRAFLGVLRGQDARGVSSRRRRLLPIIGTLGLAVVALAVLLAVLLPDDGPVAGEERTRVVHDTSSFGGGDEVMALGLARRDARLVAVGFNGDGLGGRAWTSDDGRVWTSALPLQFMVPGAKSAGPLAVTHGPHGFVAVGAAQELVDPDRGRLVAAVWASDDGIDWTAVEADERVFDSRLPGDPAPRGSRRSPHVRRYQRRPWLRGCGNRSQTGRDCRVDVARWSRVDSRSLRFAGARLRVRRRRSADARRGRR